MREELYGFLHSLPRGSRTDMGREFFLIIRSILSNSTDRKTNLRKLCRGEYTIEFWNKEDESKMEEV